MRDIISRRKVILSILSRFTAFQASKCYLLTLAVISGVFLGLSWYRPFTFLIFIGFTPIIGIVHHVYAKKKNYPKCIVWLYTWLSFFLWNAIVYWWLWHAVQIIALFAWLANAFLMTLPVLVFYSIKKNSASQFDLFAFIICWISFEYLHLHWDLSWIWLNVGNVFAFVPKWIQWYEYTGTFGGTAWVLFINVLIYRVIFQEKKRLMLLGIVFLLPILYSYYLYARYEEKGNLVEIAIIQPNFNCYTEKYKYNPHTRKPNHNTFIPYKQQIDTMIALSKRTLTSKTDFIVFPETAFHSLKNEDNIITYPDIKQLKKLQKSYPNLSILGGMDSYKVLKKKAEHTTATRYLKALGYYEVFNSAFFLRNQGKIDIYKKSKFIIAVETTPFAKLLNSITVNLGGTTGNLGKQRYRSVFKNKDSIAIAPIICYESVYGEFVTNYVHKDANLLAIITNDGWWENTPGHLQHLAYASLRAIETRRSIARSANTGISGFIDQKGEIIQKSAYGERKSLLGIIHSNNILTVYVRYGDYIARLAVFILIFMILISFVRRKIV